MKTKPKKLKDADLDKLWVKQIHARGICEYCGSTGRLNAHHIHTRSNKSTRWDLENGILLCVHHHVWGKFSAHKTPLDFHKWLVEYMGIKKYKALQKRAKNTVVCDQIYRKKIKILLENHE